MKKILWITACSIIILACNKQTAPLGSAGLANSTTSPGLLPARYLETVKAFLKGNLFQADYARLDFNRGLFSKQKEHWFLRLCWLGSRPERDFVLLQTDSLGNCSQGRMIQLVRDSNIDQSVFNGDISILSLSREQVLNSPVTNGFIETLHPGLFSRITANSESIDPLLQPEPSLPAPVYENLPEILILGTIPAGGTTGLTYSELMSFESLINLGYGYGYSSAGSGSGSGSSGIYTPVSGGGGSSGSDGSGVQISNDITVNVETSTSLPAINVQAYMKCFREIPDQGAQCSVTLFTDLPVNDNPFLLFNWNTGAVGHSYLQLTKSANGQVLTQVLGFTATKPFQTMVSSGPVAGKIVDNGGHKYNASLTMNITPVQLEAEIAAIESLSSSNYDLVNFNCVNFSVQVLNAIRPSNPLIVPEFQIPGAPQALSSTPEGLYILLSQMKAAGGAEAGYILTDEILFSSASHGACN